MEKLQNKENMDENIKKHPEGDSEEDQNNLDKKAGEEDLVADDEEEEIDDDEDLVPNPDTLVEYDEETTGDTEVGGRQIPSGQLL